MTQFMALCETRELKRHALLLEPNTIPQAVFFVLQGGVRVVVTDAKGIEHTLHFAFENQFISDYASFILQQPSPYRLEALEPTSVVVLPRTAIEWGYAHLAQGDRLGRLVAESYFVYHDYRIQNMYVRTPKERYDKLTEIFPNLHNRVPQHMIASYLGITPVHLSRLKKEDRQKV